MDAKLFSESFNLSSGLHNKGGFNSNKWLAKQIDMLSTALEGNLPRESSVPEFIMERQFDNFVDYGGGPGWIWAYLLQTGMPPDLNYFNIELASSRFFFENLNADLPIMNFIYLIEIDKLRSSQTLLCANSTLQYMDDNSELLRLISDLNPQRIILDDIVGEDEEEFFSL